MNQKSIDTKIFKFFSYFPFLWIIGWLSPYRNEKDVKFHINQGINLTIFLIGIIIIALLLNNLLFPNIFLSKIITPGTNNVRYVRNEFGRIVGETVYGLVFLIYLAYAVIGIRNVIADREKKLPIIGKFVLIRSKK